MRIKAGRYTLALVMVVCGLLIILNNIYDFSIVKNLWYIGGGALVLFGLEIITLNLIYAKREDVKIDVSVSSIFLVIFIILLFMAWTNQIHITGPFLDYNIQF
ncbi:MAG: hypothetical protein N3I35_05660 [Clostridia bacterium]|nr:hypothetical protein [Clostridia bacterium]